jgi:hypothetical protein
MLARSRRSPRFSLVALTALLAACGADGLVTQAGDPGAAAAPNGGTSPTPGAVAGIRITPREYALAVGAGARLGVVPVDANGVASLAQLAGRPTYRVADGAIATVTDTGAVFGRAAGTTKLYATLGTMVDSAVVVVTPGTSTNPPAQRAGLHVYGPSRLAVGATAAITAILLDDAGKAVSTRDKQPTWKVDDAGTVRINSTSVSDTAIVAFVTGVAVGPTVLRASVAGSSDSLAITVVGASTPPSDSGTTSTPTPPTPVAQFDLTAIVAGAVNRATAGTDTLPVRVAGAVLTVYRLERAAGTPGSTLDTLGTRVRVGSATTDANGQATFRGLAGGSAYVVSAEPPAGSPYASGNIVFPPPTTADMRIGFYLARKP